MRNDHRTIMQTVAFISLLVVGLAGYAMAQTPDGQTPAEETVCDGLEGALFGLCNAYCEALDCDEHILAGTEIPRQCGRVLKNFEKKSGGVPPPCFPETCTSTFPQCDGRCPARKPFCFNQGTKVGCRCLAEIPRCGDKTNDPVCNGECPPGSKCLSGRGTCGCGAPCPCGSTEDLLDLIGNQEACILAEEVPTGQQSLVEIIVGAGSIAKSNTLAGVCDFGGTLFPITDEEATLCVKNILNTGLPICE